MKNLLLLSTMVSFLGLFSCGDDDLPPAENEEEIIDLVRLTFTPTSGSSVIATATDPDGEGVMDMTADGTINLLSGVSYTLTIDFENTLEGEDITEEVEEEGDEHMIFFSFTSDIFMDPAGDGNIDSRADALNYGDQDANGEPIGLTTTWTTGGSSSGGSFQVLLKHQPGSKTTNSGSTTGDTDVDVSWTINIEDPS